MTDETMLFRQVHPTFIQADTITSQVFKPTLKDKGKLSLYNSESFNAENSYYHFMMQEQQNDSAGVLGITNAEFGAEGLRCVVDNDPFEGHVHADFSPFSDSQIDKKAKKLKVVAMKRGWQYQP